MTVSSVSCSVCKDFQRLLTNLIYYNRIDSPYFISLSSHVHSSKTASLSTSFARFFHAHSYESMRILPWLCHRSRTRRWSYPQRISIRLRRDAMLAGWRLSRSFRGVIRKQRTDEILLHRLQYTLIRGHQRLQRPMEIAHSLINRILSVRYTLIVDPLRKRKRRIIAGKQKPIRRAYNFQLPAGSKVNLRRIWCRAICTASLRLGSARHNSDAYSIPLEVTPMPFQMNRTLSKGKRQEQLFQRVLERIGRLLWLYSTSSITRTRNDSTQLRWNFDIIIVC